MNTCLFLKSGDHSKIDILDRQSVQIGIQKQVQLQDRLIVHLFIQIDDLISDDVAFAYNNCYQLQFIDTG